jgi:hypothetical protein
VLPETPAQRAGLPAGRATAYAVGLVDDAAGLLPDDGAVATAVTAHRADRRADHGLVVGPLLAPVSRLGDVLDALDAAPTSEPLDLVLVADTGLVEAGEARSILLDDDRVELIGLHVVLPVDGPLGDVARITLDTLDFALSAAVEVPRAVGWRDALDVLAEDGAERAAFRVDATTAAELAAIIVAVVQRSLAFTVAGGVRSAVASTDADGVLHHGAVNILAATAAALDGREELQVAALLAESDPVALLSVLAASDPESVRRRFTSFASSSVSDAVDDLRELGMLDEEE